jgi:hypothetical protein
VPYLRRTIVELWAELPHEVLTYRGATAIDGGPARTMRESILPRVFEGADVSFRISGERLKRPETMINDHDVTVVVERFRSRVRYLENAASWLQRLDAARKPSGVPWLSLPQLGVPARDLAATHGHPASLPEQEAQNLTLLTLTHQAVSKGMRLAEPVRRELAAHRDRYKNLLDDVWATADILGAPTAASSAPETFAAYRHFIAECGFDGGTPVASAAAAAIWQEVVSSPISWTDKTIKPELFASDDDDFDESGEQVAMGNGAQVPSIRRRLRSATFGTDFPQGTTAGSIVERTIEWSVEPLGLPTNWGRAIMAIGQQITFGLIQLDDRTLDAKAVRERASAIAQSREFGGGGWHTIIRGWVELVLSAGAQRSRATSHLVDSPEFYYLGRLWTRVLRQSLLGGDIPSADWVWSTVYGALRSTKGEAARTGLLVEEVMDEQSPRARVSTMLHADDVSGEFIGLPEGQRLEVADIIFDAITDKGRRAVSFCRAVHALGQREAPNTQLVETWKSWIEDRNHTVKAAFARSHLTQPQPLDLPFALVRTWIEANWSDLERIGIGATGVVSAKETRAMPTDKLRNTSRSG